MDFSSKHNLAIADDLKKFYADPLGHVMYSYPWSTEPVIRVAKLTSRYQERFGCEYGPDEWACEMLDELGDEIKERKFDGQNAVMPIRFSTVSGHGIGKSCMTAWLVKFIMDTRPLSKGAVTAVSADQLKVNTWAEVGKWHKMSITEHWFKYTTGRGSMVLESVMEKYKDIWRCVARTCKAENSEAFAGQHSVTATSFFIFDESSGIDEEIWKVREGGLTDGEPMIFDFGNPTRNSGRFYENCEGRFKDQYIQRAIDSRDVQITNKEFYKEMVDLYGEEDDYVKIRCRGLFPSSSSAQFISHALVDTAMKRDTPLPDYRKPVIIGVDVARFGDDDTVIYPRWGDDARTLKPCVLKKATGPQIAAKIIDMIGEFHIMGLQVAAIFVDGGGGYGSTVVDQLRMLNYAPIEVMPSNKAFNEKDYRLRSDEMWGGLKAKGLDRNLVLPVATSEEGIRLKSELTQREFGYTVLGGKVALESKKVMKARGVKSPDMADGLGLTYAQDVAFVFNPHFIGDVMSKKPNQVLSEYDPMKPTF